jgi:uncharacterized protein YcbK (DUF882 family)
MDQETAKLLARLRRSQPNNQDTQAACDAYEHLWREYQKLARADHIEVVQKVECPKCEENKRQVRERVARFRKRTSHKPTQ